VPLIVITPPDQTAETPAGNPEAVPMPVARVVEWVIFVNIVFTANVGLDDPALAVLSTQGVTVLVVVTVGEEPAALFATTSTI
jgi:hypothetical protein